MWKFSQLSRKKLVEPPVTTASSSRKQEFLARIASLEESLNKSVYGFDVVVSPKRKSTKWTVNIERATLKDLKDYLRELYKPPALENDGAELNFMSDGDRYSHKNDSSFREMLQLFMSIKFAVFIETPSKPFSEWTFPKVCELYGLSDVELKDEISRTAVKNLMTELKLCQKITPLDITYETTKSYLFLLLSKLVESRSMRMISKSYWKNLSKVVMDKETSIVR